MRLALLTMVVLTVAGCGFTNTKTQVETQTVTVTRTVTHTTTAASSAPGTSACGAPDLTGSFSELAGSAGAGNIVYTLRLKNGGTSSCVLHGLPQVRLLGASGKPLPTKVLRDPRFTPKTFVLRPSHTATAQARFTPDVPGPGEQSPGPCEPVAHKLRVVAGGATVVVPVLPPTRVCVHGRMTFTPYR
jgi:hypothetical protein